MSPIATEFVTNVAPDAMRIVGDVAHVAVTEYAVGSAVTCLCPKIVFRIWCIASTSSTLSWNG